MTSTNATSANAPALPAVTRRTLFGALPFACAGAAMAQAGDDPLETPVLRLFREWEAMCAAHDAMPGDIPDEAFYERHALELRMLSTPSTCAADFAAKVVAVTHWGGCALDECGAPEIWAEARQLLGRTGA